MKPILNMTIKTEGRLNMKKALVFLAAIIMLAGLATGGLYIYNTLHEFTPDSISQVFVTDTETNTETLCTGEINKEALLYDLSSGPDAEISGLKMKSYELTITNRWKKEKKYTVYFDLDNRNIFVKNLNSGNITAINNSKFFSASEIFNNVYTYRNQPVIRWSASIDDFKILPVFKKWLYKKLDGNWYESIENVAIDSSLNTEVKDNKIDNFNPDISFDSDYRPDNVYVEIRDKNDRLILEKSLSEDYKIPVVNREGLYDYKVRIEWDGEKGPYKGSYIYHFYLDIDIPVEFEFSKKQVQQGDFIEIKAFNVNEDDELFINQTLCKNSSFFKDGEGYVAYIPTGYYVSPGEYLIEYGIKGENTEETSIKVNPRNFNIQYLYIDEKIEASTRSNAAYEQYKKYFVPVRKTSNDTKYYTRPFVVPAKGRLCTEYGETRHVNDSPTSYRHSGLDIGAPYGTPIYATNTGKVVLSRFLTLTGNTVIIDHGQGLFSVYFHMKELFVKQEDLAERGQQIGTMGSTGFSTGPHLHFTMSYYDTNIEPGYFIADGPVTYDNYINYLE